VGKQAGADTEHPIRARASKRWSDSSILSYRNYHSSVHPSIHAWAGQVKHRSKRQPCPRGPWSKKSKSRCFGLTTFLFNGPAMLHRQEDEDDLVPSAPISTAPPRPFRWGRWRGTRRNQFPLVARRPIIRELHPHPIAPLVNIDLPSVCPP
jgi:hypothetical protein